jgi:transposase
MLKLPSLSDGEGSWPRILLYNAPCDMRWSFDRLAQIVQSALGEDPLAGGLFLFRSRCGSRLKILYWDQDGYALWHKRLEEGVYRFPKSPERKLTLHASELAMLLSGIDLRSVRRLKRYKRPEARSGELPG